MIYAWVDLGGTLPPPPTQYSFFFSNIILACAKDTWTTLIVNTSMHPSDLAVWISHFFSLALVLLAIGVHVFVLLVSPGVLSTILNWTSTLGQVGITVSRSSDVVTIRFRWISGMVRRKSALDEVRNTSSVLANSHSHYRGCRLHHGCPLSLHSGSQNRWLNPQMALHSTQFQGWSAHK